MPHSQKFPPKLILTLTLSLTLPTLLLLLAPKLLLQSPRQLPIPLPDELDDLSLFNRALSSSSSPSPPTPFFLRLRPPSPSPKIAFLFLSTSPDLPFSPLWHLFFNSSPSPDLFSIYIHSHPLHLPLSPSPLFSPDRFIPSKPTQRSSPTLISASRRLLAHALLNDSRNHFFALLSPSCIPLHSFSFLYKSLFPPKPFPWSPQPPHRSFIEILSNETSLRDRYNARGDGVMLPEVPFREFRVGSQFFILTKEHAVVVLKDRRLWRKFKMPCVKLDSCYPEEHYFSTLLSMEDPDGCTRFSLTRVNWTSSVGGHPHTYGPGEVSVELIWELRRSNNTYDYLFARKFSPDCLGPLMEIADDVIFKD